MASLNLIRRAKALKVEAAGPFAQYGNGGEKNPRESGAIYTRSVVKLRQVTDGTSSTLLVGDRHVIPKGRPDSMRTAIPYQMRNSTRSVARCCG